ncbi:MAG: RecQ family ATP-dependent DNA helicase [Gemmatimonadota bacterium]|nr:RecQ family ATP-dependent DNA helicase [Gemmatimonadota bacterium]
MGAPSLSNARETLSRVFGYSAFRPGQSAAVMSVLRGRDTVVILPTGGGKSLCYQVPALMLPGLTIVVSPLISLMRDQVRALRAKGVSAAFVNSTLSPAESSDVLSSAERGLLRLLYVAPERFEAGDIAERLRRRVSALAIDEAHCISQWGHDFRPSYRRLSAVRVRLGSPPTIALTATATPDVRADISSQLSLANPTVIVTGFDRTNLEYSAVAAKTDALKAPLILEAVRSSKGTSIVYAATKNSVDRIAASLNASGVRAGAYHAGLDGERRKAIQDSFMSGDLRTIVATNAFGMGIDKPDVRIVIHHSMPGTLEAYYQEAGRAGRDGKQSRVVLLHSYADRFTHEFFIANAIPPRAAVEAVYASLLRAAVDGCIPGAAGDLPLPKKPSVSARQLEGAIRLLVNAGAVTIEPPDSSLARVRLVATPDRIKRELGATDSIELGLLRELWKHLRHSPQRSAEVDFNQLPPGLNGFALCRPLLDALQERQFIHWTRTGAGVRLADPAKTLAAFRIDWAALERRRKTEFDKLDTMQRYAWTRGCRRTYFLRYFGETSLTLQCASCDNCR